MALDALRSTFNFKRPAAPAGPIPGWGQPAAPVAPEAASPDVSVPPGPEPIPYQATSYAPRGATGSSHATLVELALAGAAAR